MDFIKIIVQHSDHLAGEALTRALDSESDMSAFCFSESQRLDCVLEIVREQKATILILDYSSINLQMVSALRRRQDTLRELRTLVIGVPINNEAIMEAIQAGACGYETCTAALSELLSNIRALASGETICPPDVAALLFDRLAHQAKTEIHSVTAKHRDLTKREFEVIELLEEGLSNKAIARRLNLSVQTVKNHVHHILGKLRLRCRTEVARYARDHGLLPDITGYKYHDNDIRDRGRH